MVKIGIIQIRGSINTNKEERDTLRMLNLFKKHNCSIFDKNPVVEGMLKKVKHLITWGEIDKDTLKELILKRGEIAKGKKITEDYIKKKVGDLDKFLDEVLNGKKSLKDLGIKPFFRLAPPKKGFERLGIKKSFNKGGALGYRGEKINDLIKRMI